MSQTYDFSVSKLGECKVPSPVRLSRVLGDSVANYVTDDERIVYDIRVPAGGEPTDCSKGATLEVAGPRDTIYFSPGHVHAAIVSCGGLCPGINDVIRGITRSLWHTYGVRRISGIRFGYAGLLPESNLPVIDLNPDEVDDIHKIGGSMLGSSRGGGDRTEDIVDGLERLNVNMLFVIGGDGTQKGALAISEEVAKRGLKIAVVGIPKTIDNDLSFIQKSFGFETAVAIATQSVSAAHTEAHSAINGVGLVKLMGRESGFISAHTALASHEVNFVLVPEVPFELDGDNGLLEHLRRRLERRGHAVIIVAEGAGRDLVAETGATDASGNAVLSDIGTFLKDRIKAYFASIGVPMNLKYIDPSYIIRSAVAEPTDSVYCSRLANNAVHAAMAGKTGILMSLINNTFVHLPIRVAVKERNRIDPESSLWRDVVDATHQPVVMTNDR